MKQFKNTFGVTGSKASLEHFAELAIKEGWELQKKKDTIFLYFQGKTKKECSLKLYHFWYCDFSDKVTNIDTIEGFNKAYELMREEFKYDFVCPHSGYGFNEGDEYWVIYSGKLDLTPAKGIGLTPGIIFYAYFPTRELAIEWSIERFVEKEQVKESLVEIGDGCGNMVSQAPLTIEQMIESYKIDGKIDIKKLLTDVLQRVSILENKLNDLNK